MDFLTILLLLVFGIVGLYLFYFNSFLGVLILYFVFDKIYPHTYKPIMLLAGIALVRYIHHKMIISQTLETVKQSMNDLVAQNRLYVADDNESVCFDFKRPIKNDFDTIHKTINELKL